MEEIQKHEQKSMLESSKFLLAYSHQSVFLPHLTHQKLSNWKMNDVHCKNSINNLNSSSERLKRLEYSNDHVIVAKITIVYRKIEKKC